MSRRHAVHGTRIDRSRKVGFTWDGRRYEGFAGDTLASALLANDVALVGRSFKYHRPRGVLASGPEEPNALVGLGAGGRFEPNARATMIELVEGLEARPQNAWPTLAWDFGALAAWFADLLPAGFYYKTFMAPRAAWKALFEPLIRRSAGLGAAPDAADADVYEHRYAFVDVLVVGGGVAGLAAARTAAAAGARVMVLEQSAGWGGRAVVDGVVDGGRIAGADPSAWVAATLDELRANPAVQLVPRATATSIEDHAYVLAAERLSGPGPRERLWRIRAGRIVVAAGAIERPLPFAGNDLPGVMLASAVRDYLALWGVAAGARVVIATASDDAYRTALALHAAGVEVPAIIDARDEAAGALPAAAAAAGLRILTGAAIAEAGGAGRLDSVGICDHAGTGGAVRARIACDALAMSGGWSPAVHLWSQPGGKVAWDAARACFLPDPARPPRGADGAVFVLPAGAAAGAFALADALASGWRAGRAAAEALGLVPGDDAGPEATDAPEAPALAVWRSPARAGSHLRKRTFIDFQNDVKATDVELAAREGYASVEHAKRYTTLGMATDQGKTSNVPGLATLAAALGADIPSVGVTTFRPPYTPVTFGTLVGEARGPLFKPTRRTPMDAWHDANGAEWEPVADWRRPYCYLRPGETKPQAVAREVRAVRAGAGLLDASTLGKILVAGPDAGRFLDLVYTGVMSSLAVGRCRYGLMCTENGFLFDDGVVARLGERRFLCHTTTGGSDRVHAWMEEWLQTEWHDLDVWVANLTEQFAQIAVAGPRARDVLAALGGVDLDPQALPHMAFAEAALAGLPARVHRISFTGELSYEIAVPAGGGQALWDALLAAGAAHDVQPYGTEAMHVLRAEKGYIMIGDETDGTVTPQDLGLGWAVSKKKPDFIGKRAQERADLTRPGRKQLVGLLTEDPKERLPDGALAVDGHGHPLGHVTSSYLSPTLGRAIAMALIEGGAGRMGETLDFPLPGGGSIRAAVAPTAFYDPEGERLHG